MDKAPPSSTTTTRHYVGGFAVTKPPSYRGVALNRLPPVQLGLASLFAIPDTRSALCDAPSVKGVVRPRASPRDAVAEAGGHEQCALLVKRSHIDEQGLKLEMGDGSCGRDWLFAFMRNAGRCGPPIAPLPPHGMPPLATSLSALLICSLPPSHVVDDARAGVIGLSAPRRPRSSLCSWLVGA